MAISTVKCKLPLTVLVLAAGLTAILSWLRAFPATWVEAVYSRSIFPTISHSAGFLADAVPFSWLDLGGAAAVAVLLVSAVRRSWRLPLGMLCAAYLVFFWGWGLNYHRPPIELRLLGLRELRSPSPSELDQLAAETASQLNQLWPAPGGRADDDMDVVSRHATERVRHVIQLIDGKDWAAATRVKHTLLMDWWFRMAGIEGMFNPFGHEPLLTTGALRFHWPFLTAHELAHVHGIADEGDANFVAYLASLESGRPDFQYSAAFEMWLHLGRSARLLDAGPRQDLQTYYAHLTSQEIPRVTHVQSVILDSHLKANGVPRGVQSYARIVSLAVAARSRLGEFR